MTGPYRPTFFTAVFLIKWCISSFHINHALGIYFKVVLFFLSHVLLIRGVKLNT